MYFLEELLPLMERVYDFTECKEIMGEKVPNDEKLFSIYEQYTDIIVKGGRKVAFGHKVNLTFGKSNLILSCKTLKGNPSYSTLFQPEMNKLIADYNRAPKSSTTDGGYASKENMEYAKGQGITNIVFNKIVGSMKNTTSIRSMETRLKKWRSGIEAVISNFKRKFGMFRCNWKGFAHFETKVLWNAIAYNIRVMTALVLEQLEIE